MSIVARKLLSKEKKIPHPSGLSPSRVLFEDIYNIYPGECRWPTHISGARVKDCDFTLESKRIVKINSRNIIIVTIPRGTELYHATVIPLGSERWFYKRCPENLERGLVWFASTPEHSLMINHTHLLTYKTTEDLTMIYEQNLKKYNSYGERTKGYEYAIIITALKNRLEHHDPPISVDGYVGCNECEIGIFNTSVKKKIEKIPVGVTEKSLKYID